MTGGGGFLGSHLVDYLMTRGDHVRAGPTAGRHAQCTPRSCLAAATVGGTYSRVLSPRRDQLLCHLLCARAVRSAAESAAECLTLNWLVSRPPGHLHGQLLHWLTRERGAPPGQAQLRAHPPRHRRADPVGGASAPSRPPTLSARLRSTALPCTERAACTHTRVSASPLIATR